MTDAESKSIVLITGASRGIGACLANTLAESGRYRVFAGVRPSSKLDELRVNEHLQTVHLDVTDDASVKQAVGSVLESTTGRLDVLINNAGIMYYGGHENVTTEEAKRLFDVNYFGCLRVTNAVLPTMRSQNRGHIIQIGSRSGFRPLPCLAVYGDAKAALLSASEQLAALLTPWNIRVSVIEPGPVLTDLDATSTYGTRLARSDDPYYRIFERVDMLPPPPGSALGPGAQPTVEIAEVVLRALLDETPSLRYQTTARITQQAGLRAVDPTGNQNVDDLRRQLFP